MAKDKAAKATKINPVALIDIPRPRRVVMEFQIKSIGPGILQDRMNPDTLDENDRAKADKLEGKVTDPDKAKAQKLKMYDRESRFEEAQYRQEGKRGVYHPGRGFQRAIWDAAVLVPGLEKSRARLNSAVTVLDDMVELIGAKPQMDVRVCKQPGRTPGSKVPVLRSRALSPSWTAKLNIQFDPDVVSEEQVGALLARAGYDIGVGNFTPQKRGPYGMFELVVGRSSR